MQKFLNLMEQVSFARVFVFFLLWSLLAFVVARATMIPSDIPQFADFADPPAVTQLYYSPSSLHAVVDPKIRTGSIRVAWISASPGLYGNLSPPRSVKEPPGFIQAPVARELTKRLGRPVAIEAYAMPNSRIMEKYLATYHALQTKPNAIVISLNYWDFNDHSILMPRFQDFRIGLMAKHPLAIFQSGAVLPFLHPGEIGWAWATTLLPILNYREEIGAKLKALYARLDPLRRQQKDEKSALIAQRKQEALLFFTKMGPELGKKTGLFANERILDAFIDMIRSSGIPAFIYVAPAQNQGHDRPLVEALTRYRSTLPAAASVVIEPRSLNAFLKGIVFRNANHLERPAPVMTNYLADQIENVLGRRRR